MLITPLNPRKREHFFLRNADARAGDLEYSKQFYGEVFFHLARIFGATLCLPYPEKYRYCRRLVNDGATRKYALRYGGFDLKSRFAKICIVHRMSLLLCLRNQRICPSGHERISRRNQIYQRISEETEVNGTFIVSLDYELMWGSIFDPPVLERIQEKGCRLCASTSASCWIRLSSMAFTRHGPLLARLAARTKPKRKQLAPEDITDPETGDSLMGLHSPN